jgi:hypothetical protein
MCRRSTTPLRSTSRPVQPPLGGGASGHDGARPRRGHAGRHDPRGRLRAPASSGPRRLDVDRRPGVTLPTGGLLVRGGASRAAYATFSQSVMPVVVAPVVREPKVLEAVRATLRLGDDVVDRRLLWGNDRLPADAAQEPVSVDQAPEPVALRTGRHVGHRLSPAGGGGTPGRTAPSRGEPPSRVRRDHRAPRGIRHWTHSPGANDTAGSWRSLPRTPHDPCRRPRQRPAAPRRRSRTPPRFHWRISFGWSAQVRQ